MNRWKGVALVAISFNVGVVHLTGCEETGKDDASGSSDEAGNDEVDPAFTQAVEACMDLEHTYDELVHGVGDDYEDYRENCEEDVEVLHVVHNMSYESIATFYECWIEPINYYYVSDWDQTTEEKMIAECCAVNDSWSFTEVKSADDYDGTPYWAYAYCDT